MKDVKAGVFALALGVVCLIVTFFLPASMTALAWVGAAVSAVCVVEGGLKILLPGERK